MDGIGVEGMTKPGFGDRVVLCTDISVRKKKIQDHRVYSKDFRRYETGTQIFLDPAKGNEKISGEIWKNKEEALLFRLRCTAVCMGYYPAKLLGNIIWLTKGEK